MVFWVKKICLLLTLNIFYTVSALLFCQDFKLSKKNQSFSHQSFNLYLLEIGYFEMFFLITHFQLSTLRSKIIGRPKLRLFFTNLVFTENKMNFKSFVGVMIHLLKDFFFVPDITNAWSATRIWSKFDPSS